MTAADLGVDLGPRIEVNRGEALEINKARLLSLTSAGSITRAHPLPGWMGSGCIPLPTAIWTKVSPASH